MVSSTLFAFVAVISSLVAVNGAVVQRDNTPTLQPTTTSSQPSGVSSTLPTTSTTPSSVPPSSFPASSPTGGLPPSSVRPSSFPASSPTSSIPTSSVRPSSFPASSPTGSLPPSSVPPSTFPASSPSGGLPPSSASSSIPQSKSSVRPSSVPPSSVPPSSVPQSSVPPSSVPTFVPPVTTGGPTTAPPGGIPACPCSVPPTSASPSVSSSSPAPSTTPPAGSANCDGVQKWQASFAYNAGNKTIFNDQLYTALQWTYNNAPPAHPDQWAAGGQCSQPIKNKVDCTGVGAWQQSVAYTTGNQVTFNGHLWAAVQWTQSNAPGDTSGVWQDQGICK